MARSKIKAKYRVRMVALKWWVDLYDQKTDAHLTSLGPFSSHIAATTKAKDTGWPDYDKG